MSVTRVRHNVDQAGKVDVAAVLHNISIKLEISNIPHTYLHNSILLINADSRAVLPHLPTGVVSLYLSDPPYGNSYRTNHRKDKTTKLSAIIENNTHIIRDMFNNIIADGYRVMTKTSALYWFIDLDHHDALQAVVADWFTLGETLIWVKNNWTAGNLADYARRTELIIYAYKPGHRLAGGRDHNILSFNRVAGKAMLHPNHKPISCLEYIIAKSTKPGDIVLDTFGGSGSTAEAAYLLGRAAIYIELDTHHYNTAVAMLRQTAMPLSEVIPQQPLFTVLTGA